MSTSDHDATNGNGNTTRRLLSSLRDVLFENTSQATREVSASVSLPEIPTPAEVEVARAVLRAAVEADLGAGIHEFSLQDEALSDALPDPTTRRRAVLRVLALKGTTRDHLCLELERALATLATQGSAFAHKLQVRRDSLLDSQRAARAQCEQETSDAQQAIARLQADLEAQRATLNDAQARRDEALGTAEAALAELGAREQSFQAAYRDVEGAYVGLKTQLSQESL